MMMNSFHSYKAPILVAILMIVLGLPDQASADCTYTQPTSDCNDPSLAFLFGLVWIYFVLLYPLTLFMFVKWLISYIIESVRIGLKQ